MKRTIKKCQKFSKTECKELFIEKWNNENKDFQISIASLYRWLQKYKNEKTLGLVYKRGGHNKVKSPFLKRYGINFVITTQEPTKY